MNDDTQPNDVYVPTGWYTDDELRLLRQTAREVHAAAHKRASFVEVGVFRGRSAMILAQERQDRDLWLIDDCSMEGACQMTWPRGRNIIQVCKPAEEFIFCKPIALLHLDADHTEPVVREHLFKYAPHVVVGGAIVFHDFGGQEYPGVKAAWEYWLNQVASRSRHWQKTAAAGSVQVVRRV